MTGTQAEKRWTEDELEQQYYIWLTNWIPGWQQTHGKLLQALYETPFRVTLLMDENRVGDGLALRTRFVYETGRPISDRETLKNRRPCGILEVMIALALRFEEEYMRNTEDEDPVGMWFAPMLDSLGLMGDGDGVFEKDQNRINLILLLFLDRAYAPDGRGGLFYIPGVQEDMREIEIWRRMMMWHAYNKGGNG